MSLAKARGIILKTMDYRERDRILQVFSLEMGKISILVRGARSGKGQRGGTLEGLQLCDFVLFPGKSLYSYQESSTLHSFQTIRSEYEAITRASYYLELCDVALADREVNEKLFYNLMKALYLLDTGEVDGEVLTRAFEWKVLVFTGNPPDPLLAKTVTPAARGLIRTFLNAPLEECLQQRQEPEALEASRGLALRLFEDCFFRIPKSLALLDQLPPP
ncbi:hypothetical protein ABB02_02066 [Clostridiaceae bacterium JG1575]|nr:hypothetical protein ABB02_02066 [Clostridiaceae bacterium JG1575]